jgi:UDP:flavonoid glycosyltransferase YjiC (YdhE family)
VARFVLALHDAGGTVPPMLAIAEALVAREHAVTVLGQTSVGIRAQEAGCEFIAFNGPDYATDRPLEQQLEAVLAVMAGRGPGDDLLSVIAGTGAEVVLLDCNLAGAAAAAEASGCRSAILLHSLYKTYVDTWFGEIWPYLAPAINDTRAAFGLDARESWTEVFVPHDRLYAAVPAVFDAPTSLAPPASLHHTGFLVPTADESDRPLELGEPEEPAVLVSLSTTDMGQGPLLQTILDALDGQEVRAIATVGGQHLASALRIPSNVIVHDHVPHGALLPHVDAVVTHAGLGTVAASLSHGVPMVCTPIARDQPLNAERVAEVGAGETVPAADATPESVRAALAKVLSDARYRQAAKRVAIASAEAGGAIAVARDLEKLSSS